METLKLQTNIPEVIALEFAEGLPIASKFGGDQIGNRAPLATPSAASKRVQSKPRSSAGPGHLPT